MKKRRRQTAVRVYVLDASGSMFGARAEFRDALLIAELNAIRVKASLGVPFDPLYFCFFNDLPTKLTRIDSAELATQHIEALFKKSPAHGQTDITMALREAFASVRNAAQTDPYLARATVVLVTDGEDGVDLGVLQRAKRPVSGVEIALSFISLGQENRDLKANVLEQRARGQRAFYHHLTDAELKLAPTEFDSTWRTLLPTDITPTRESLERLSPFFDALEAIAERRPVVTATTSADQFDSLFPSLSSESPRRPAAPADVLVARLVGLLDALGEAVSLAPLELRAAEAAQLVVHLLSVYGVSMAQYLETVRGSGGELREKLETLRRIARPTSA